MPPKTYDDERVPIALIQQQYAQILSSIDEMKDTVRDLDKRVRNLEVSSAAAIEKLNGRIDTTNEKITLFQASQLVFSTIASSIAGMLAMFHK